MPGAGGGGGGGGISGQIFQSTGGVLPAALPARLQATLPPALRARAGSSVNPAALGLVGAGVGASLLGGTLGVEAALAPFFAWAAAPLALAGISLELVSAFSGRPKMLDTFEAVARLALSKNPAVQNLAKGLAVFARNGVPLSTGNPKFQSQIRDLIAGTIMTIGQQAGLSHLSGEQVGILDKSIRNVLTSEIANPGTRVDDTIRALGLSQNLVPAPAASSRDFSSPRIPKQPNLADFGVPARGTPRPPMVSQRSDNLPPNTPGPVLSLFRQFEHLASPATVAELAGCITLLVLPGTETLGVRCLEGLIAKQIEQTLKAVLESIKSFFVRQPQILPPAPIPQPQPFGQPRIVPTLDQTSDCPECDGRKRKELQRIRAQQRQLSREIDTEQSQELEEQLSQQEQEITHFAELEQQPASQRDIQSELQRKAQIQQQLQQEEQQLQQGGQPQIQPPSRCPPGTHQCHTDTECETYGACAPNVPVPTLQQNETAQQLEHEIEKIEESKQVGIQFCVGCKSQDDAILFLNGEPSECSVIKGSTKELTI